MTAKTQLQTTDAPIIFGTMQTDDLRRDDEEHPIPNDWRSLFQNIANAFAEGDFRLKRHPIKGVAPIDEATAVYFEENATAYGDPLARLDSKTWERSIYRRTHDGWIFLVDLTTEKEEVSDLSLHAKLHEATGLVELQSVHVP